MTLVQWGPDQRLPGPQRPAGILTARGLEHTLLEPEPKMICHDKKVVLFVYKSPSVSPISFVSTCVFALSCPKETQKTPGAFPLLRTLSSHCINISHRRVIHYAAVHPHCCSWAPCCFNRKPCCG